MYGGYLHNTLGEICLTLILMVVRIMKKAKYTIQFILPFNTGQIIQKNDMSPFHKDQY